MKKLIVSQWYAPRTSAISLLLSPLAWLYGLVMAGRNFFYDHKILPTHRLRVPVVSVGNFTVGGTGKTPLVIHLAQLLRGQKKTVAILTRGYGGDPSSHPLVLLNGQITDNNMNIPLSAAGDEPVEISRRLPEVPVIVNGDRVAGGSLALQKYSPQVILLDDGFQHRRLHRDLDIVVVDSKRVLGNRLCLPAGPLREFPDGIKRAGAVYLNLANGDLVDEKWERWLAKFNCQLLAGSAQVRQLVSLNDDKQKLELSELAGKKIILVSAIGKPEGFAVTVEKLKAEVVHHFAFPDHYQIQPVDWEVITKAWHRLLKKEDEAIIITTGKDAARISFAQFPPLPIYVLEMEIKMMTGQDDLSTLMESIS